MSGDPTYELLKDFDVYGTGGDSSACAREVLMQLSEANTALSTALERIRVLEGALGVCVDALEDARSTVHGEYCANHKPEDCQEYSDALTAARAALDAKRGTG